MKLFRSTVLNLTAIGLTLSACNQQDSLKNARLKSSSDSPWHLMLAHDSQGVVLQGAEDNIVGAVRRGCQLRIAWGSIRTVPSQRSVEHVADIKWVTVRNGEKVNAQIGDFLINLAVLGEPQIDNPRYDPYGGTETVVKWRADLKTDGTFNAVWFEPHTGAFITRRPQRHPMRWFADCRAENPDPLYIQDTSK